jgi:hypothetical protein
MKQDKLRNSYKRLRRKLFDFQITQTGESVQIVKLKASTIQAKFSMGIDVSLNVIDDVFQDILRCRVSCFSFFLK